MVESNNSIPEFRICSRPADDGTRRMVYNIERWQSKTFTGGLHVKKHIWCDPMYGTECDYPSRAKAMEAFLKLLGVRIDD